MLLCVPYFMANPLTMRAQSAPTPSEQPVTLLQLAGPLNKRYGQFSGMAWHGDTLVFLPQYPAEYDHHLLTLPKQAIVDALRGANTRPLQATLIPLFGFEALEEIEGFEGFEAIAFAGERIYLTIEARRGDTMLSVLVTGLMLPDQSAIRLYPTLRSEIPAQSPFLNLGDEALIVRGDEVITFYEANGLLVNPRPVAHRFDAADLTPLGTMPMARLDYRLTDAALLADGERFWVINTFFPGELLSFGPDALASQYGRGPTHSQSRIVERLVQLRLTAHGVELVPTPPVQLQLTAANGRNWEGLVRLDSPELSGFLLITDRRPTTLLGFVADSR
jgi:hypothetical protein